jgi:aspartyl-tRNA(Asn)/glutamyl-tRNA(Gln) amidotransferase subunit C
MSLDRTTVEQVARLARLALAPDQVTALQEELNGILALVARLQSADITAVEPLSHPLEITARLRPDVVTEADQREVFQAIAPAVEAGLYLVPRVIE